MSLLACKYYLLKMKSTIYNYIENFHIEKSIKACRNQYIQTVTNTYLISH